MQQGVWIKYIYRHVTIYRLSQTIAPVSDDAISLNMEIAKLPGKWRKVLLYYYQNMKIEEAAEALDLAVPLYRQG